MKLKKGELKSNARYCYFPLRLSNGKLMWLDWCIEVWEVVSYYEVDGVYHTEKLKWSLKKRMSF